MDIKENHANNVNRLQPPMTEAPDLGYAPENIFHGGPDPNDRGGWTGFNWGPGGALAASAYLDRKFGAVWVDGETKQAIAVDGLSATVTSWNDNTISLTVASALGSLPHLYTETRQVTVRFGRLQPRGYTVIVNGRTFGNVEREKLDEGITVRL